MRSLVDFFNHGILPFVGREGEIERLVSFWKGTAEAPGLRVALVVGEAGVGKSRLLEEIMPKATDSGGLVVHTKLYRGAATSLSPLLARALWQSNAGRQLLKKEPEETVGSVIVALQRLARLRPTLLVIEDLHLLQEDALAELMSLFEGLSDEPISVIGLARPVDLSVRGLLERYLVEEIVLGGLKESDVAALWRSMLGVAPEPAIVQALLTATSGNPLAFRSALRGVLKSGGLARPQLNGPWRVTLSLDAFQDVLARHVSLLSGGMAAHLNEAEREAAGKLATLGEVFCRASARVILDDADRSIDLLTFKGILGPSITANAPLSGEACSDTLIVFTHSLLHKYFLERPRTDCERMLLSIAAGLPLYSVVPFQLIADWKEMPKLPTAEMRKVIDRALEVAEALDKTLDWELARLVLSTAEHLTTSYENRWSSEENREIRILLLRCELLLRRRELDSGQMHGLIERMLTLTAEPLPEHLMEYRITALRYHLYENRKYDLPECHRTMAEVDEIIMRHPWLRLTQSYMRFLQHVALSTGTDNDNGLRQWTEERFNAILSMPETTEEIRRAALHEIGPQLIAHFRSKEQLEARMRLLAELETTVDPKDDLLLRRNKIALLQGLGFVDEALRTLDETIPLLREQGLVRQIYPTLLIRLWAIGSIGAPFLELERQAHALLEEAPEAMRSWMRERIGIHFARIGIVRGDVEWARRVLAEFGGETGTLIEEDVALASTPEELDETLRRGIDEGKLDPHITAMAMLALGDKGVDRGVAIQLYRENLGEEILSRSSVQDRFLTLTVLDRAAEVDPGVVEELHADLRAGALSMLEWTGEHKLAAIMTAVLERCGVWFTSRELAPWRSAATAIVQERSRREAEKRLDDRLEVSMLGTVEVCKPDGSVQRVRGARLRLLLGLMVADRMLEKPLTYREFCRIAASGEEDPERARKVMNMAVLRLREVIGTESILTDSDTPKLNLTRVRVDLLEAHHALREAEAAAREGSLLRALPLLLTALDLSAGEVPFPSLFDDFFEAAREDFEFTLRAAIIDVVRGLLREGDAASAETVLRRGFEAMPEDEEIVELLRQTLVQLGKRIEAERVRMRAAEALAE